MRGELNPQLFHLAQRVRELRPRAGIVGSACGAQLAGVPGARGVVLPRDADRDHLVRDVLDGCAQRHVDGAHAAAPLRGGHVALPGPALAVKLHPPDDRSRPELRRPAARALRPPESLAPGLRQRLGVAGAPHRASARSADGDVRRWPHADHRRDLRAAAPGRRLVEDAVAARLERRASDGRVLLQKRVHAALPHEEPSAAQVREPHRDLLERAAECRRRWLRSDGCP